jgi:hypothetical protein
MICSGRDDRVGVAGMTESWCRRELNYAPRAFITSLSFLYQSADRSRNLGFVRAINQSFFSLLQFFELLFAAYGFVNVVVAFPIDEADGVIVEGESAEFFCAGRCGDGDCWSSRCIGRDGSCFAACTRSRCVLWTSLKTLSSRAERNSCAKSRELVVLRNFTLRR